MRENLEAFDVLVILAAWQSGPQIQQAGAVWQISDFVATFGCSDNELLRNRSIPSMKRERMLRGQTPLRLEAFAEIHGAERHYEAYQTVLSPSTSSGRLGINQPFMTRKRKPRVNNRSRCVREMSLARIAAPC